MSDILSGAELEEAREHLPEWQLSSDGQRLARTFTFKDFAQALAFVNRVGEVAEKRNHHPDVSFGWGRAEVSLTSHDSGGLTERDVALAEELDRLPT